MTNLNDVLLAMSNIPVDDPIAEIWGRGLQGGYTVIEYTGALPITINADGNTLLDYRIYGNTVQNGTPTPENPIIPSGCGERTENLFDLNRLPSNTWTTDTRYYIKGGVITSKNANPSAVTISVTNDTLSVTTVGGDGAGFLVKVKPSTEYRLFFNKSESLNSDKTSCVYALVDTSETIGRYQTIYGNTDGAVFTTDSNTKYVYFVFRKAVGTMNYSNIMLSEGQTALPYEPYGYKLPILSNSTVTNIYLGEVETTRRIKKLAFNGNENWRYDSVNTRFILSLPGMDYKGVIATTFLCSHYEVVDDGREISRVPNNTAYAGGSVANPLCYVKTDKYSSAEDFKTYLAAQYAAGTPVTVWYVLAEPETGIVNEPLMKIGDYADTVSMEQAGVSIPTNKGSTVIDYDGALKPSQMYIKYLGR